MECSRDIVMFELELLGVAVHKAINAGLKEDRRRARFPSSHSSFVSKGIGAGLPTSPPRTRCSEHTHEHVLTYKRVLDASS
mmetsp:Transcript_13432/g.29055  ORF Transcript_13432/g.29055 Transcript_13432/m.29055 type:complete len:81 (-) Transcript_13432:593-835(-)